MRHFQWIFPGVMALAAMSARADETRYYRVNGPSNTAIIAFQPDGWLSWSNRLASGICVVETATSIGPSSKWHSYVRAPVMGEISSLQLFDPAPPSGMVLIPAGSFMMGNATNVLPDWISQAEPQHIVYVSAFFMDKYEVTKGLWDDVFNWAVANGYNFDSVASGKATNHPVGSVNWWDAVKWCNARSEKEGLTPAYYTNATMTGVYRNGNYFAHSNAWVKWNAGYRLPTEAEWEKACRGGIDYARFPWANHTTDTIGHSMANYRGGDPYNINTPKYDLSEDYHPAYTNGGMPYTSPVGSFAPNGYGLYDVAGNVEEWCWDLFQNYQYLNLTEADPRGPADSPGGFVRRGGSWQISDFSKGSSGAPYARCAFRDYASGSFPYGSLGFRCARGR